MKKRTTILGIIPARGGSKRIPKKNIVLINNKPLIYWTIRAAKKSKRLDDFVVSSDSAAILSVAKMYGAQSPFRRPKILARDTTPSLPVIQHALLAMEKINGKQYTHVVILEPTSPLRLGSDIDGAIEKAIRTKADSVISVYRLEDIHPVRTKKIVRDQLLPFSIPEHEGTRRQDLAPAYYRNGAVYVISRKTLLEMNSLWGKVSRPYIMPEERSIDIDSSVSLRLAEQYLRSNL